MWANIREWQKKCEVKCEPTSDPEEAERGAEKPTLAEGVAPWGVKRRRVDKVAEAGRHCVGPRESRLARAPGPSAKAARPQSSNWKEAPPRSVTLRASSRTTSEHPAKVRMRRAQLKREKAEDP